MTYLAPLVNWLKQKEGRQKSLFGSQLGLLIGLVIAQRVTFGEIVREVQDACVDNW